jgi:hypothetical protein
VRTDTDRINARLEQERLDVAEVEQSAGRRAREEHARLVRQDLSSLIANQNVLKQRELRHFRAKVDPAEFAGVSRQQLREMNQALAREIREIEAEVREINGRIMELAHQKEQIELHRRERRLRLAAG